LKAPNPIRLRRPVDVVHVVTLAKSYASGDTGAGRVMTVNLDSTCSGYNPSQLARITKLRERAMEGLVNSKDSLSFLVHTGVKFETINGNHRREAGDSLRLLNPAVYNALTFSAAVYIDLTPSLAFQLASKANMNAWEVRRNTFYEDVIATRIVSLFP
jgi:hypothetical protein